jgi:hypothetical protein
MSAIVVFVRALTCRLTGAGGGNTTLGGARPQGRVSAPSELLAERLPAASNAFTARMCELPHARLECA